MLTYFLNTSMNKTDIYTAYEKKLPEIVMHSAMGEVTQGITILDDFLFKVKESAQKKDFEREPHSWKGMVYFENKIYADAIKAYRLAAKYKINEVRKNLYKAQKELKELKKKASLTSKEKLKLAELNRRSGNGKTWDYFYWTDNRFYNAWKEFNKQPASENRNVDYDFWIRTGIRWLFEKRKSVKDWADAIRAYNGSGATAQNYKKNVIERRNRARKASEKEGAFKPKITY